MCMYVCASVCTYVWLWEKIKRHLNDEPLEDDCFLNDDVGWRQWQWWWW